ncbi:hypothetical protein MESS4_370060 [Mesorhizobium sp. STM 4661]|nr:hypothetical protein MESS4_370060 [Mesorhizobium sp. STM 4661]
MRRSCNKPTIGVAGYLSNLWQLDRHCAGQVKQPPVSPICLHLRQDRLAAARWRCFWSPRPHGA